MVSEAERGYRVLLQEIKGLGARRLKTLIKIIGSAEAVWQLRQKEVEAIGLPKKIGEQILEKKSDLEPLSCLAQLAKIGVRALVPEDQEYPSLLRETADSPQVLFVRGSLNNIGKKILAVVGTRYPTPYGREVVERLVAELVVSGWVIISGLARGIDGIAHRVTVEGGGRTVAVLGGGIDKIYPPEHAFLARRILETGGAIVSEYSPGMIVLPGNFPARNRIISGMSLGVLVVEGAQRSGTKITARLAVEQGREVFAVPGPIMSDKSQAPADLIKEGAKLVTRAADITEEFGLADSDRDSLAVSVKQELKFTSDEEKILFGLLKGRQIHLDELVRQSGLETAVVSAALSMMEIRGLVKQLGGMVYTVQS